MRLLLLALEGLWWRRATSLMLLIVAVFTTAAAAAAPSYAASAQDAVLQAAVRPAPLGADGTGVEVSAVQTGRPSTTGLRAAVDDAFTGPARAAYPKAVLQLSATLQPAVLRAGGVQGVALATRDDVCAALHLLAGRCVTDADPAGVVVEQAVARVQHLAVGQRIAVVPLTGGSGLAVLHVRGIAERREPAAAYWFGTKPDVSRYTIAAWVPAAYFSPLTVAPGDGVTATADLPLDRGAVHLKSVQPLLASLAAATRRLQGAGAAVRPEVTSDVDQVLQNGVDGGSRLLLPIVVVIAELLALGWFVLHALVSGSIEARGAEVALSKVRGMSPRGTLVLVLLEPALLLAAAVPLGVLAAAASEAWLVPKALPAGAAIDVGALSWAAALIAAAGGLLAATAASGRVLRRPVLEQWRRTSRAGSRGSVVAEVVIVVLAVVGIAQLQLSGSLAKGAGSGIALLAPMLLIVAGAVVASRVVVLLARLGFAPTRGTGAVSAFVGLRQLARRPAGRRVFGVLVVAVAMAMYGVSSAAVLAQNRTERALTEVGAPMVLHITPDPRTEQRIRAVDPAGRELTPVAEAPVRVSTDAWADSSPASSDTPSILVVDPKTFGAVAYWRGDFGSRPLPALLRPLSAPAPASPVVRGTRIILTVTGQQVPAGLELTADLTDARGAAVTAVLGTLRGGTRTYSAAVNGCADGCRLRRIYVPQPTTQNGPLVAAFTVRGLSASGGTAPGVAPTLTAVGWSPLNPIPDGQVAPAEKVTVGSDGVHVTIGVGGQPSPDAPGFGAIAGAATAAPALVAAPLAGGGTEVTMQTPDAAVLSLHTHGAAAIVPRLGDSGVVVARDWVEAASPSGFPHLAVNQIWVGARAPRDVVGRLRAAGVHVASVERASTHAAELASAGPAFATPFTVAGGLTAVLLAAAAIVLTIALLARRRRFELSAMRALGIRTRSLLGSVVVEQGALIVAATVCGSVLALAGVRLALPALPAYVDDPPYPAFVVQQPLGTLALVGAAIAVLLLAAATVTALVLTRSTSVTALREAEQ